MKRFLQATLALLLLAAALVLTGILLEPMLRDSFGDLFGHIVPDGPAAETASISVRYYRQDPDSGAYVEEREESRTVTAREAITLTPAAVEHYTLNEEKSRLTSPSVSAGEVFVIYYDCETCLVRFAGGEGATLTQGSDSYTVRKGQSLTPPVFEKTGYTLTGYDKEIAPVYQDTVFTASWEITRYVLRLYTVKGSTLNGTGFTERADSPGCFETTFTILDSLTLPDANCPDANFLSWNTRADGSGVTYTALPTGQSEELSLYAILDRTMHSIDFEPVDGVSYPSLFGYAGEKIAPPTIAPIDQKPGMGLNWYTDKACTKLYTFTVMPSDNLTLYGKWVTDTGTGFLGWDVNKNTIDTPSELVVFMDYVRYYDLKTPLEMEVTYASAQAVMQDLAEAAASWEFRAGGTLVYSAERKSRYKNPNAQCVVMAYVSTSYRDTEASLSMPASGKTPYDYLLDETITPRGDTYTDFYIDSLKNTYPVETSNQLHYVVEHGYRPLPVKGSDAERIYNAARDLLNDILPQNATDYEKVLAIFEYLVLSVEYDLTVADASESASFEWALYDAYHLEGVFDNKKAVCDGIAKAFSLLCNIEGIPCVEVSGNSHAWNRVKVNNGWYVVDATFGNLHLEDHAHSVIDHGQFLISDAEKTATGYASRSYTSIHALSNFNHFAYETITTGGLTFDLVITDVDELTALLSYLLSIKSDLDNTSVDLHYQIGSMSFHRAYEQARETLEKQGYSLAFHCYPYGLGNDDIYKLVFVKAA